MPTLTQSKKKISEIYQLFFDLRQLRQSKDPKERLLANLGRSQLLQLLKDSKKKSKAEKINARLQEGVLGDSEAAQNEMIETPLKESINNEKQNEIITKYRAFAQDLEKIEKKDGRMNKIKKIGIALILIGIFIPLVTYPFTTIKPSHEYRMLLVLTQGSYFKPRLSNIELVIKEGKKIKAKERYETPTYEGRVALPYNWLLSGGIFLVFCGLWLFLITGKEYQIECID